MSRSNITISLTSKLRRYVDQKLASGSYQSASEVVREGLRLLQNRDLDERDRRAIRKDIAQGWQESQRGELIDGDVAYKHLLNRLQKKTTRK